MSEQSLIVSHLGAVLEHLNGKTFYPIRYNNVINSYFSFLDVLATSITTLTFSRKIRITYSVLRVKFLKAIRIS